MSRHKLVPAELDLLRAAFDGARSWGEAYERLLPVLDGILEARAGDFAPQVVVRADRTGIMFDPELLPATGLLVIREADVPPLPELRARPPLDAEGYYVEHGWSGCAGSAWSELTSAAQEGWRAAAREAAARRSAPVAPAPPGYWRNEHDDLRGPVPVGRLAGWWRAHRVRVVLRNRARGAR